MRTLLSFVFPKRSARQVPFGRVSIFVQLLAAAIFLGYILINAGVTPPLVSDTYEVEVAFDDASGLDEDNRPTALVSGIDMGLVREVRLDGDIGIARVELDGSARGRIFADAGAEIRPINAINQIVVNIHPGTPSSGPLPDGEPIPAKRTSTHVQLDRVLDVLDTDTRAFLAIAIDELERSLRGRSGELRAALVELGELTEPSARVADALADRRRLLARLVEDLDVVFTEVAKHDRRLSEVVAAGSETLAVTGARQPELERIVRELPGTLAAAQRALAGGRELSEPLVPALDRLREAARPLPATLRETRAFLPRARLLLEDLDALTREAPRPVRRLTEVAARLEPTAALAKRPVRRLLPVLQALDARKLGIVQGTELVNGTYSTNDETGPRARTVVLGEALAPENLGLPRSAAMDPPGGHSELERKLARAFEMYCKAGSVAACTLRVRTPGLPKVGE